MKITRDELKEFRHYLHGLDDELCSSITEALIDYPYMDHLADRRSFRVESVCHDNGHDCWGAGEYYYTHYVVTKDGETKSIFDDTLIVVDSEGRVIDTLWRFNKKKLQEAKELIVDQRKKQLEDFVAKLPG